ncbi:MAG: patatin-like phospholipase family protein, partial [Mesorhizobium sp.]
LHSALAASAAIPAVFRPVVRNGCLLIDGGIYNPVPFDLLEKDADIIIAIDVVGAPSDAERKHPTTVDLM